MHQHARTALDRPIDSVALKRLTDEIAKGAAATPTGYNRSYNRHNR